LPLAELIPLYIEHVEGTYRGKDRRYASRKATDLSEYVAAHWKHATEITADDWREAMMQLHHKKGGPLRWRSIAHVAHTLRLFLEWCRDKGVIEDVPEVEVPGTDEQRMDASDRRAFTEDEMEMFLWALAVMGEGHALRIYITLFETWQRKSTIEAMTPRWVNFHNETITIPAKHFKTKREKVIDLTPRAAEAIRSEIAEKYPGDNPIRLDEAVFGPFDFHQEAVRKWKDRDGNEHRYDDGGVFARACRMAGIDQHGLTPHHVTRHTAATLALENGVSILGVMAQGGWDSMQSMQRYTHANLQHARQAARARVVAR
jgi:integrase